MFGFKSKARKRREVAEQLANGYIREAHFWRGIKAREGRFDAELFAAQTPAEYDAVYEKIVAAYLERS
jgi:hypothetical protein